MIRIGNVISLCCRWSRIIHFHYIRLCLLGRCCCSPASFFLVSHTFWFSISCCSCKVARSTSSVGTAHPENSVFVFVCSLTTCPV
eukprot:UN21443